MDIVGKRMFCIGCFREGAMVKLDKKQRPYFVCECCGTRSFFRGVNCLRSWGVVYGAFASAARTGDQLAARGVLSQVEAAAVAVGA